jgi:hypothetical protein
MRTSRNRRARSSAAVLGCLLVLGPMSGGIAAAERGADGGRRTAGGLADGSEVRRAIALRAAPRFGADLTRRVDVQLESLSAIHILAVTGHDAFDHVLADELTADVRRGAERATRRAVREYFLETFSIEQRIDLLSGRVGSAAASDSGAGRNRFGVGLGIHSLEPQLDLEYRLDDARLGVTLGAAGDVGLTYRSGVARQAGLGVSFDGRDAYAFSFRLGF